MMKLSSLFILMVVPLTLAAIIAPGASYQSVSLDGSHPTNQILGNINTILGSLNYVNGNQNLVFGSWNGILGGNNQV